MDAGTKLLANGLLVVPAPALVSAYFIRLLAGDTSDGLSFVLYAAEAEVAGGVYVGYAE